MRTEATPLSGMPIATAMAGSRALTRLLLIVVAVSLLSVSAKIQIPLWPVPMTMQTYVVLVIGMSYGFGLGITAVGTYLALGALGLPVFAGTPSQGVGWAYIVGPTGGYLVGFLIAAAACGILADRGWDRRFSTSFAAMVLGHAIIFAFGVTWLAFGVGIERAVELGLRPFLVGTLLKTLLAAGSLPVAWRFVR